MRRFYLTLILLLPLLGGCQKLVRQEIDSLQEQIDLLQGKVASANRTLESIRQLLTQMENGGRIKSAVPVSEDGRNGYLITFNDGRTIRIWSGKDGAKGEPGPEARIAVKAGEDGLWYWTLDGEWLKDSHGNRIRVTGDDGTSPVLKIEDGDWFISYGDGWVRLGKAVGDDGNPGGEGGPGEDAVSFFKGIEKAVAGNHLYDISNAIADYVEPFGYGIVEDLTGHGIGRHLHEDPMIPNYRQHSRGIRLRAGMTLAVEPMIALGTWEVDFADDGWTCTTKDKKVASHYENTILVTEGAPEILTLPGGRRR